jgi:hypothetical protein
MSLTDNLYRIIISNIVGQEKLISVNIVNLHLCAAGAKATAALNAVKSLKSAGIIDGIGFEVSRLVHEIKYAC